MGKTDLVSIALNNDFPYLIDNEGNTPLSFALQNKDTGVINVICQYFYENP
jgi:hypothetical protein